MHIKDEPGPAVFLGGQGQGISSLRSGMYRTDTQQGTPMMKAAWYSLDARLNLLYLIHSSQLVYGWTVTMWKTLKV